MSKHGENGWKRADRQLYEGKVHSVRAEDHDTILRTQLRTKTAQSTPRAATISSKRPELLENRSDPSDPTPESKRHRFHALWQSEDSHHALTVRHPITKREHDGPGSRAAPDEKHLQHSTKTLARRSSDLSNHPMYETDLNEYKPNIPTMTVLTAWPEIYTFPSHFQVIDLNQVSWLVQLINATAVSVVDGGNMDVTYVVDLIRQTYPDLPVRSIELPRPIAQVSDKVDIVYGPYNVKLLSLSKIQSVLLFGERHSPLSASVCDSVPQRVRIDQYLSKILYTFKEFFFDVFVELPLFELLNGVPKFYTQEHQGLNIINETFLACVERMAACEHDNLRIHFIDTRPKIGSISALCTLIQRNQMKYYERIKSDVGSAKDIAIHLLEKVHTFIQQHASDLKAEAKNISRMIDKEADRTYPVFGKVMQNTIIARIYRRAQVELRPFSHPEEFLEQITDKFYKDVLLDRTPKLMSWTLHKRLFLVHIVDIYALMRMLHEFDVVRATRQPFYAKNVVVYAGERHTDNFFSAFESFGYSHRYEHSLSLPKRKLAGCVALSLDTVHAHLVD